MTPSSNALRVRIEAGGVTLGVLDNAYYPTLVEFHGELGLDSVWLNLEHGGPSPLDSGAMEDLLRAAERTGIEPLVRLPTTDPEFVRKVFDLGVRNVFLPRVESAEEVRKAVRPARFTYGDGPGDRDLASPRARRWGLADDYVAGEDHETFVGVTIETAESLADLDAILNTPELGFVLIEPFDLLVAFGHPGEIDHPGVREAVGRIRSTAVDADIPVGGSGFGMDNVNEKAGNGYQLINLGNTTGALKSVVDGWFDTVTLDHEGWRPPIRECPSPSGRAAAPPRCTPRPRTSIRPRR